MFTLLRRTSSSRDRNGRKAGRKKEKIDHELAICPRFSPRQDSKTAMEQEEISRESSFHTRPVNTTNGVYCSFFSVDKLRKRIAR